MQLIAAILLNLASFHVPCPTYIWPQDAGFLSYRGTRAVNATISLSATQQHRRAVRIIKARQNASAAILEKLERQSLSSLSLSKPPASIREVRTTIRFRTDHGEAIERLRIRVEMINRANRIVGKQDHVTGEAGSHPGDILVVARSFPVMLRITLLDDTWEVMNPTATRVRLVGTEGITTNSANASNLQGSPGPHYAKSSTRGARSTLQLGGPGQVFLTNNPAQRIRTRTYDAEPPIIVRHRYAEFAVVGQPKTAVTFGDEVLTVTDALGNGRFRLLTPIAESQPTLCLELTRGAARYAGILHVTPAPIEGITRIPLPNLTLVGVTAVEVIGFTDDSIGIMTGDVIRKTLGKPDRVEQPSRDVTDAAQWWHYSKKGLSLKMLPTAAESGKQGLLLECIRMTSADAGHVAGLRVGAPQAAISKQFGPTERPQRAARDIGLDFIIDQGIAFKSGQKGIDYIELRRPFPLLIHGIETEMPRSRMKIFVTINRRDETISGSIMDGVRDWLSRIPGVEITLVKATADYELKLVLANSRDAVDSKVAGLPTAVSSHCQVSFALAHADSGLVASDPMTGIPLQGVVEGKMNADYRSDVLNGGIVLVALELLAGLIKDERQRQLAHLTIAALGISITRDKMVDVMERARTRCRLMAAHQGISKVVDIISTAVGMPIRVRTIDRGSGILTINAGTMQGVNLGAEFVLLNAGTAPFLNRRTGLASDCVIARVITAGHDVANCEIRHVRTNIDGRGYATYADEPFPKATLRLLDAETALVSAVPFLRIASQ